MENYIKFSNVIFVETDQVWWIPEDFIQDGIVLYQ